MFSLPPTPGRTPTPERLAPTVTPTLNLSEVNHLVIVMTGGRFEPLLPSLFAAAALYRSVALVRGDEPTLHIVGAQELSRPVSRGFSKPEAPSAQGNNVLLVSPLLGSFSFHGPVAIARVPSIAAALDRASDAVLRHPITSLVRRALSYQGDSIARELLALADGNRELLSHTDLRRQIPLCLSVLKERYTPLGLGDLMQLSDPRLPLRQLVVELASGSKSPSLCSEMREEHLASASTAEAIWNAATPLSERVFQIERVEALHQDPLVGRCLESLYLSDPIADYVLERHADVAPTLLSQSEVGELRLRMHDGESPSRLLLRARQLLEARGDQRTLVAIERAMQREQGDLQTVAMLLEGASHDPDADGAYTFLKAPPEAHIRDLLERARIPLLTTGASSRFGAGTGAVGSRTVSFQAKHLQEVLGFLT